MLKTAVKIISRYSAALFFKDSLFVFLPQLPFGVIIETLPSGSVVLFFAGTVRRLANLVTLQSMIF
ncbi:hypothetical protein L9W92_08615 [Pelotomaculum terephthalicicum JT]|uniref:hypothetical protein n=1 Tax=Pelotomaculum terephthalicicum TaxID=206393 RepID=UPI001F04F2E0|nr:hypothetical protein [Pelotomaculum terephthalicicum]MCG9968110.1 hypothetical protein [Pelotomaculum terephthalicicum JT]